ncbi:WD-40 repeat-containing protein [Planoprotostelium fungivorum]|uniref:WD-40 repeat-containing protein n=1 Tax=Planoprotostelium fungivorum TaxID=1890364 RepID=A0A2P6NZN8_9EUKA|nr:WD-40 repeat-containing protein [Planoprotostelium fungivorum]
MGFPSNVYTLPLDTFFPSKDFHLLVSPLTKYDLSRIESSIARVRFHRKSLLRRMVYYASSFCAERKSLKGELGGQTFCPPWRLTSIHREDLVSREENKATSMPALELIELPVEVLCLIAVRLEASDLARLARTCQLLRQISLDDSLWERFSVARYLTRHNVLKAQDRFEGWRDTFLRKTIEDNKRWESTKTQRKQTLVRGRCDWQSMWIDDEVMVLGGGAAVRGLTPDGIVTDSIRVYDVKGVRLLRTLPNLCSVASSVVASKNTIVTAIDNSVTVWSSEGKWSSDGEYTVDARRSHDSMVRHLSLRQDTLVSCGNDGTIKLWNVQDMSATCRGSMVLPFSPRTSIIEDTNIHVSGKTHEVFTLDPSTLKLKSKLKNHINPSSHITCMSSRFSHLLVGDSEGYISLYDHRVSDVAVRRFRASKSMFNPTITSLCWDESSIACGDAEGKIRIIDTVGGKRLFKQRQHRGRITGMQMSTSGLVSASTDGLVKLWKYKL